MRRVALWAGAILSILIAMPVFAGGDAELEIIAIESVIERTERAVQEGVPFSRNTTVSLPRQDEVIVLTAVYDPDTDRKVSLFYPPGTQPEGDVTDFPVMFFPMGFQEEVLEAMGVTVRYEEGLNRLAEHLAVLGMVVVLYDNDEIVRDFELMFDFLIHHQDDLRLDMYRIAVFAYSGHGRFSSRAMDYDYLEGRLKVAVFVYADPRPISLPDGDVAFFLAYPRDGSVWERCGKAMKVRAERAEYKVVVVEGGLPKLHFFSGENSESYLEIFSRLSEFLHEHLGSVPGY